MHALSRFYPVLGKALTLAKGRRLSLEEGAVKVEVIHPQRYDLCHPSKCSKKIRRW
jgi:hypothetical protein